MTDQMWGLITLASGMFLLLAAVSFLSQRYSLDQIKSKTVGDGQYGSARWATPGEIRKTYVQIPFRVSAWRRGIKRPTAQGLVVGSVGPPSDSKKRSFLKRGRIYALVDCDNDGKPKNRVVLFCDELGTMPPFDILPLFSAGRSRRLTLVPIIQSLAQLEKNYGKEGSEIIRDNCQDTIFGGFAPGSQTAEVLSKALGSRTVQVGSVSQSKHDPSRSLQMVERPLMTADELRSIPKGSFIVMKTGCRPMQTRLRLFLDWGITFEKKGYAVPAHANRKVSYAGRKDLEASILGQRMQSMGPTGAASGKRYRSNERSGSETPPDTAPGSGLKT